LTPISNHRRVHGCKFAHVRGVDAFEPRGRLGQRTAEDSHRVLLDRTITVSSARAAASPASFTEMPVSKKISTDVSLRTGDGACRIGTARNAAPSALAPEAAPSATSACALKRDETRIRHQGSQASRLRLKASSLS